MSGPHLQRGRVNVEKKKRRGYRPIFDVGAASKGVADDHDIVSRVVEPTPGFVRDGDISQKAAIFERKSGYDVDGLLEDGWYDGHVVDLRKGP